VLQTILETGSQDGMNLVVFGGGFAATLVAFLVHSVFEVCCWPCVTHSSQHTDWRCFDCRHACCLGGKQTGRFQ
jgi:hypothetical protein